MWNGHMTPHQNPTPDTPQPHLREPAAAAYLGITVRQLKDMRLRRQISYSRVGKFAVFDIGQVLSSAVTVPPTGRNVNVGNPRSLPALSGAPTAVCSSPLEPHGI
jgi:hypothetical protein